MAERCNGPIPRPGPDGVESLSIGGHLSFRFGTGRSMLLGIPSLGLRFDMWTSTRRELCPAALSEA